MNYKTNPGIAYTNICGEFLLIPTREASERCPSILRMSAFTCTVWEAIEKEQPVERVYHIFKILMKDKTDEEIYEKINTILNDLCEKGFIYRTEEPQL